MNSDVKIMSERLSALADGELHSVECAEVVAFADTEDGRASWHAYQVIGDVLRSSELARPASCDLVSRLRVQLAQESATVQLKRGQTEQVVSPAAQAARVPDAANSDVFRWKMVAGFASLAAVATIGWNAYSGIANSSAQQATMQLAVAPSAALRSQSVAQAGGASATGTQASPVSPTAQTLAVNDASAQPVMIRDPRLDDLLAAHKQFGSTSALQMPAGFLRNATFEAPAR